MDEKRKLEKTGLKLVYKLYGVMEGGRIGVGRGIWEYGGGLTQGCMEVSGFFWKFLEFFWKFPRKFWEISGSGDTRGVQHDIAVLHDVLPRGLLYDLGFEQSVLNCMGGGRRIQIYYTYSNRE